MDADRACGAASLRVYPARRGAALRYLTLKFLYIELGGYAATIIGAMLCRSRIPMRRPSPFAEQGFGSYKNVMVIVDFEIPIH